MLAGDNRPHLHAAFAVRPTEAGENLLRFLLDMARLPRTLQATAPHWFLEAFANE